MIAHPAIGNGGRVITPADDGNPGTFKRLYVGGTGHVTLIGLDGQSVLLSSIPAGTQLEIGFTRIMATGTTATLLVGIL